MDIIIQYLKVMDSGFGNESEEKSFPTFSEPPNHEEKVVANSMYDGSFLAHSDHMFGCCTLDFEQGH